MEREREREYRGLEWSLCNLCRRRESSAADGVRVWGFDRVLLRVRVIGRQGGFRLCCFVFWVLWVTYEFKCCLWGGMAEWYSSFMSSGTNQFFKFQTKMVRCHVDEKKRVLELTKLEYHKKWYLPKYFRNSVADPIISKISANGPFCPSFTRLQI